MPSKSPNKPDYKRLAAKGILIVDDSEPVRIFLSYLLEFEGFTRIYQASSVEECLNVISEQGEEIYVILLDLLMPGEYGLSLMEHHADIFNNVVAIIVVSAISEVQTEFFQLGSNKVIAYDFQLKPFRNEVLVDKVWQALELVDHKRKQQTHTDSRRDADKWIA